MNPIKSLIDTFRQYRAFRATVTELSQLTDADLKDIGICRNDIIGIAYKAAEESISARKIRPIGELGLSH